MLKAEIVRPSELGTAERVIWSDILAAIPGLQRAFLSIEFAQACELAYRDAYVGVLHENGAVRGFLPYQFRSSWHRRLRMADRIGEDVCDNAGVIAKPDVSIEPASLLQCCRLSSLLMTHMAEEQAALGLATSDFEIGHRIDLSGGLASFIARLVQSGRRGVRQDTERRLRRAGREYGTLRFTASTSPQWNDVAQLVVQKQYQYRRTGVADVFDDPRRLRLLQILTERQSPGCLPLLTVLTAGDRVLARHFGLLHAGVLSYWFPVYDPEAKKISPGRLLLWHTIERAESLGIRLIDRGAGDSEAKRDLSTGSVRLGRLHAYASDPRGWLARGWQSAAWRWKCVKANRR